MIAFFIKISFGHEELEIRTKLFPGMEILWKKEETRVMEVEMQKGIYFRQFSGD